MKSLQYQIVLAVANGCRNTRQIAKELGHPFGFISAHLWPNKLYPKVEPFVNGDLLQWEPGKANTLRLGGNVAVLRKDGKAVWAGVSERIDRNLKNRHSAV